VKPAAFDYKRPDDLDAALGMLAEAEPAGRVIAGGQSLGPMLNLRLARPGILVDITAIPELRDAARDDDGVMLGACVTHASIEDGSVPDATNGVLARIAGGIAYRAVRNRGTIGGSLAHADPAADWVTTLAALGAEVRIAGASGERRAPVAGFLSGAFETGLNDGEILRGVHIPAHSTAARWGYYKFCRKAGDFADAMAAVLADPETGAARTVIGATHAQPIVVDGEYDAERVRTVIDEQGFDAHDRQTHLVAAKRAATIAGLA
jgi:carbon-monoxide dehydrogenase medium subunit